LRHQDRPTWPFAVEPAPGFGGSPVITVPRDIVIALPFALAEAADLPTAEELRLRRSALPVLRSPFRPKKKPRKTTDEIWGWLRAHETFPARLRCAFEDRSHGDATQFRIHLSVSAAVIAAGLFRLAPIEWAVITVTIGLVLGLEPVNTMAG
jgi:hypothetical protein